MSRRELQVEVPSAGVPSAGVPSAGVGNLCVSLNNMPVTEAAFRRTLHTDGTGQLYFPLRDAKVSRPGPHEEVAESTDAVA